MKRTITTAYLVAALAGLAVADDSVALKNAQPQPAFVPGEVIVRYQYLPTAGDLAAIEHAIAMPATWREIPHAPHAKGNPDQPHPLAYVRVISVAPDADVEALSAVIGAIEGVTLSSVNNIPQPTFVPNDTHYNSQWAHQKIHSESAWDISLGTHDIIVASIDTGTVLNHEDLITANWVNTDEIPGNGIDDDANGFIDDRDGWNFQSNNNNMADVFGHGTQVAGIMSADINNAKGVAGIAETTVMHIKWWHTSGSDASIAGSVFYAVDNGARALNMSLSGSGLLPLTEAACNYAEDNNVLSVAAAGNHGGSNRHYPAGYDNVMAISGIDINDQKPGYSGWGSHIDVAGPTDNIWSTGPGGNTNYVSNFNGTSASSPHVCGVAGLVLSINPDLTAAEVRQILRETATDVGAAGFDNFFGFGRVDAGNAAAAAIPQCPADLDGDSDVDADDFFTYLDLFAAGSAEADLDNDGDRDADDFFSYLDLFNQGC